MPLMLGATKRRAEGPSPGFANGSLSDSNRDADWRSFPTTPYPSGPLWKCFGWHDSGALRSCAGGQSSQRHRLDRGLLNRYNLNEFNSLTGFPASRDRLLQDPRDGA